MLELEISKFSRFFLFENLYLTIFQELKKRRTFVIGNFMEMPVFKFHSIRIKIVGGDTL